MDGSQQSPRGLGGVEMLMVNMLFRVLRFSVALSNSCTAHSSLNSLWTNMCKENSKVNLNSLML